MILVCSNGQSNLQEKQSSKQGTSSSSANFKDREPPTWRFEKIELEKQIKDWKKKCEELQEETKKAPPASIVSVRSETEDAVSCVLSACSLLCEWPIGFRIIRYALWLLSTSVDNRNSA